MHDYAIRMMGQRRPDENARQRAMVRLNGMMFYAVGVASFLESTPPLDTGRLVRLAEEHADLRRWLSHAWLPRRADHGRAFREYLETVWPEFDWRAAYAEFAERYGTRTAVYVGPAGLGLEYLARCVNETALTVFYRTLGKCADDPSLRALAREAARDHGEWFVRFRGLYESAGGGRRAGLATACRTVLRASRAAREVDVAEAFRPLARHWQGGWVFPELAYPEFLARLAELIRRHGALGPVERALFSPWLSTPRPAAAASLSAAPAGTRGTSAAGPAARAA